MAFLLSLVLAAAQDAPESRPFRMGFTAFPHDLTAEAVEETRRFVHANADIIAHHIEGVPWAESTAERPLPPEMVREWEGKKSMTPPGAKVYLAVSPGRGDLKVADKAAPLPPALKGKAYDDPEVKRAYLRYCREGIRFFKPDYLAIGIEVNEICSHSPAAWRAYVGLHRFVYEEVKKDHPDLPVFASFTLHNLIKNPGAMLEKFMKLMPFNDVVAVSYYPFMVEPGRALTALDWMTERFDRFRKPYAVVETNDAAERLPLPGAGVVIEGTPARQRAYYEKLFSAARDRKFAFVISFVHRDYDALWEKIKGTAPEFFVAWRDCGLVDGKGEPRPAFELWRRTFALPLSP
jgi:hypothetical protein